MTNHWPSRQNQLRTVTLRSRERKEKENRRRNKRTDCVILFWLFQNRRQQPRRKRLLALRLLLVQQSCFPYLSVVGLKQAAVTRRSAISMQINRRRPARPPLCRRRRCFAFLYIAYTHPIHRKKRTHWHCSLADTLKKLSSTKTKEKQQTDRSLKGISSFCCLDEPNKTKSCGTHQSQQNYLRFEQDPKQRTEIKM